MYHIFLTGTTGFLGTEIISELMRTTDDVVYGLTRAGSVSEVINILTALWHGRPELTENLGSRILPMLGNITEENLGLSGADQEQLMESEKIYFQGCADSIGYMRKLENAERPARLKSRIAFEYI